MVRSAQPTNCNAYPPADFASRISRCRIGSLSMVRVISRTSHGKGLRSCTRPSLLKMTNINPRGRSFLRAERSGVVTKVNAGAGDSLAVDDVIMEFE